MPRLWISAGHSGVGESGTQSKDGTNERDVTIAVLKGCAAIGMRTIPLLTLKKRIEFANRNMEPGDYLIELHTDMQDKAAGTDCGIYYHAKNKFSQDTAARIVEVWRKDCDLTKAWKIEDTKARQGRLGIIRDTTHPAWLLEMTDVGEKAKREFAIYKGPQILKKIEAMLFKQPEDDEPSEWARPEWEEVVVKGIFTTGRPKDAITDNELQHVLVKLHLKEKVTATPMTRQEVAKIIVEAGLVK